MECVARLIISHGVGFGLDDHAACAVPKKFTTDQLTGADAGISLKKLAGDFHYPTQSRW